MPGANVVQSGQSTSKVRWGGSLLTLLVVLTIAFGDRLGVVRSGSGGGGTPIFRLVVFCLLAVQSLALVGTKRNQIAARGTGLSGLGGALLASALCYASLTILLPLAGVVLWGGRWTQAGASIEGAMVLVSIVIGYRMAIDRGDATEASLLDIVALVSVLHATYAAAQVARLTGFLPAGISEQVLRWDRQSFGLRDTQEFLVSRPTGLFTNPNLLGIWGASVLWPLLGRPMSLLRRSGAVAAVLCLLLSVSRGAIVTAMLVGLYRLALWAIDVMRLPTASTVGAGRLGRWLLAGICGFALIGTGLAVTAAKLPREVVQRYSAGMQVLTGGRDDNLSARMSAWSSAIAYAVEHPWGTFGPPQVELGRSPDNEFVRLVLQGGALLVGMAAIALLLPMLFPFYLGPSGRLAATLSCGIVVGSLTSLVLVGQLATMMWLTVGAILQHTLNGPFAGMHGSQST